MPIQMNRPSHDGPTNRQTDRTTQVSGRIPERALSDRRLRTRRLDRWIHTRDRSVPSDDRERRRRREDARQGRDDADEELSDAESRQRRTAQTLSLRGIRVEMCGKVAERLDSLLGGCQSSAHRGDRGAHVVKELDAQTELRVGDLVSLVRVASRAILQATAILGQTSSRHHQSDPKGRRTVHAIDRSRHRRRGRERGDVSAVDAAAANAQRRTGSARQSRKERARQERVGSSQGRFGGEGTGAATSAARVEHSNPLAVTHESTQHTEDVVHDVARTPRSASSSRRRVIIRTAHLPMRTVMTNTTLYRV